MRCSVGARASEPPASPGVTGGEETFPNRKPPSSGRLYLTNCDMRVVCAPGSGERGQRHPAADTEQDDEHHSRAPLAPELGPTARPNEFHFPYPEPLPVSRATIYPHPRRFRQDGTHPSLGGGNTPRA